MTISTSCHGGSLPPQQPVSDNRNQASGSGKRLEITLSITIDDDPRTAQGNGSHSGHGSKTGGNLFDAQGNPLAFNDGHLYGGQGGGTGHSPGQFQNTAPQGNTSGNGNTQGNSGTGGTGNNDFDSINRDLEQRNQRMLQANLEAMELMDRTIAETAVQASIAQSQKLVVDTKNAISNGYVDSANKANNANTQSGKGINF
ncbi:hypothetical protein QCD60_24480 [Pokkaliibacter sp. MBI-7]|uniref:hypothetical protein n=1 Tax=Pokkaliibacter sp. MBI-7 TaxID=3040600 RepID=UPI00244CBF91|nr:hypothetical protein [Pokkaliibacter sp. MBI-7]MDH2435687.1 hypothetical protein [Pokkaliibacter sp. MBI-7]